MWQAGVRVWWYGAGRERWIGSIGEVADAEGCFFCASGLRLGRAI